MNQKGISQTERSWSLRLCEGFLWLRRAIDDRYQTDVPRRADPASANAQNVSTKKAFSTSASAQQGRDYITRPGGSVALSAFHPRRVVPRCLYFFT
jgi:hypothetical protein